jgi:hypothetical protein
VITCLFRIHLAGRGPSGKGSGKVVLAVVVDMGIRGDQDASRLGWSPQGGDDKSTGQL